MIQKLSDLLRRGAPGESEPEATAAHGPWCEPSMGFLPEHAAGLVVPIRIAVPIAGKMASEDGWTADVQAVFIRPAGDGTFNMSFREADEVDLLSNRRIQKTLAAAYDLVAAIDATDEDLPDDVVLRAAEVKRHAKSGMRGK